MRERERERDHKANVLKLNIKMTWTSTFERFVVKYGIKNWHQKDVCLLKRLAYMLKI